MHDGRRALQARSEPVDPVGPRRRDRDLDELVGVEGQHGLEADARVEQRLRGENVGARRERTVGETDPPLGDERADLPVDLAVELGWKAARAVALVDQMAAEVEDQRRRERGEHVGRDRVRLAHESKLAARDGHRRVVVAGQLRRDSERAFRVVDAAEDQRGLGGGCLQPVVVGRARGAVGLHQRAGALGELACAVAVAGEQSERSGVDARVVAPELHGRGLVEIRGASQTPGPIRSAGREGLVLRQARDERGGVLAQRDRHIGRRPEPDLELQRGEFGPGRPLPNGRAQRGDETGFEVVGIGLHGRHRLVVRDQHVAVRDRGACHARPGLRARAQRTKR